LRGPRYAICGTEMVDGTELKQAREPGVQNVSRRQKYKKEKYNIVGSAAKQAMSLVYRLPGDAVLFALRYLGVVDDGGKWSTLNDVALILSVGEVD
jgi:hypothetical protein